MLLKCLAFFKRSRCHELQTKILCSEIKILLTWSYEVENTLSTHCLKSKEMAVTERYINPFTDFGFKKLFGTELNKDLLIDFLNEVILPKQK